MFTLTIANMTTTLATVIRTAAANHTVILTVTLTEVVIMALVNTATAILMGIQVLPKATQTAHLSGNHKLCQLVLFATEVSLFLTSSRSSFLLFSL
jgi:2-phosphoglycerate kinase